MHKDAGVADVERSERSWDRKSRGLRRPCEDGDGGTESQTHCMSVSRRVWGLPVATPIAAGLERLECGVEPVVRTP